VTTTYDPRDASYADEADVRDELSRVYDVCHGCRQCVSMCSTFPTLFEMLDGLGDGGAGDMTPAQQDVVADSCFQCKLCISNCPYQAGRHDASVDFPRLMLRASAMRRSNNHVATSARVASKTLGRADLVGKVATVATPAANALVGGTPGSLLRKLTAKLTGVSPNRVVAPFATQRFSSWFAKRPKITMQKRQAAVSIFPTCLVEYQATDIGKDLVKVYERNGVECNVSGAGCCGAPLLHAGDTKQFAKVAAANVAKLAQEIHGGADVVVPQPGCRRVITHDYVDHVQNADAELVASRTYDAVQYLMTLHRGDNYVLDTEFEGVTHRTVTYHAPSVTSAERRGFAGRDLIRLTGARINMVQQSSGVESLWGLSVGRDEVGAESAERLLALIDQAGDAVVAGDSHLANTAITEHSGRSVMHPLQVLARAYGIPEG
jgi:glycerol-3-phosphate dehydrogenase subunit C